MEYTVPISEWDAVIRMCVAALLSGALGFEREVRRKEAGLRTYTLVGVGAALFTVVGPLLAKPGGGVDPTRIAAQVVSGIGFIGAGLIFQQGSRTKNLTTAAGIWATAAVGVAAGSGLFIIAGATTALMLIALTIYRVVEHHLEHPKVPLTVEDVDGK